ncbi:MAG: threonine ammonia-lyase [Bdellovibrionales bacterium]|nr:threonine ammonia-lyase [Bdellovibrionales bacterium]
MAKLGQVTLKDVHAAELALKGLVGETPLVGCSWLSERLACEVYLKLETSQPIGAFKIRGATYRIASLTDGERARGVIAASAGNHGQGVAWGARKLGCSAVIVMPKSAPLMKLANVKALGAEVVQEGESYEDAYAVAQEIAAKRGLVYVHAYEDPHVIAGQGVLGLEILRQLPDVQVVMGSVGGGGLMAGICAAFELHPQVEIVGCQAKGAAPMARALERGQPVTLDSAATFADGIAVRKASEPMRKLLAARMAKLLEADDEAIAGAVVTLMERAKVVAEGAGALPLACLKEHVARFKGKKVALIVSGGNIDVNLLSRILDLGLIRTGRRIRVNVFLPDRPGSLNRLTQILANESVNVLQAIHDRNEPAASLNTVEVALTLETRGREHADRVIAVLEQEYTASKVIVAR